MASDGRDGGRENARRTERGYHREVRGREKARGVVVRYSVVLCGVRGYRSHRDISSGRPDTPLPSPGTAKAAAQKPRVLYSLHAPLVRFASERAARAGIQIQLRAEGRGGAAEGG